MSAVDLPSSADPHNRAQQAAVDPERYAEAVANGAQFVQQGLWDFEDVEAQDWMGDITAEQFAADIKQFVDEDDTPVTETTTQADHEDTITDPRNVDWAAFWDEFSCPHDHHMSHTQLKAALNVSDDISVPLPAKDEIEPGDGHAPVGLVAQWVNTDAEGMESTIRGYALPQEVRRDE